uniref:Uncharacterized protein n=1 Tax=Anopheles culicifacies TaxID=139723 RepID=A0A182MNI4_9DIPT
MEYAVTLWNHSTDRGWSQLIFIVFLAGELGVRRAESRLKPRDPLEGPVSCPQSGNKPVENGAALYRCGSRAPQEVDHKSSESCGFVNSPLSFTDEPARKNVRLLHNTWAAVGCRGVCRASVLVPVM